MLETTARIEKLAIAVTFHFVPARLKWLALLASNFPLLARDIVVCVTSNRGDDEARAAIAAAMGDTPFELVVPTALGHPLLLTWTHRAVFRELFASDPSITHFLYLEDDILIEPHNIAYWLAGREALRPHGFYPSLLRYEINHTDGLEYATDVTRRLSRETLPQIMTTNGLYLGLPEPYQGMYLLDREQMDEHLSGPSSSPNFSKWRICEKATQGLTFANVPVGFHSRNLVRFDAATNRIDRACLVHHLPDNYANDPQSAFGKTLISDLVNLPPPPARRPLPLPQRASRWLRRMTG